MAGFSDAATHLSYRSSAWSSNPSAPSAYSSPSVWSSSSAPSAFVFSSGSTMGSQIACTANNNSIMNVEEKKIKLKLVVDKEKKRVVFVEADKDFVDILFSFLTLPLGSIIRLLDKQSTLGSLSTFYESIENLDTKYLQTEACKTMLLHPQSAAALLCEDLKLNVDDTEPRKVFHCRKDDCCAKAICLTSTIATARCPHCQQPMDKFKIWPKGKKDSICEVDGHDVFTKENMLFMISDNLQVIPASLAHSLSLLQKMGIEDVAVLEERRMDIGRTQVLDLLKRSLISNAPLTEIFFNNEEIIVSTSANIHVNNLIQIKTEGNLAEDISGKVITVSLLVAENKVLAGEVGEDFADIILSFLTLPLGSVIKVLNNNSCMGCIDNLYRSAQELSSDYIKSNECRDMLLSPKLAPFFGCENGLLKMDEVSPRNGAEISGCYACYWNKVKDAKCKHGVEKSVFTYLNPKSQSGKTEAGGGYAKGPRKFMVTDDLHLSPFSPVSISQLISRQGSPVSRIVIEEVKIKRPHVLALLKAALISKTPLSDVFLSCKKQMKRIHYDA